MLENKFKIH